MKYQVFVTPDIANSLKLGQIFPYAPNTKLRIVDKRPNANGYVKIVLQQ